MRVRKKTKKLEIFILTIEIIGILNYHCYKNVNCFSKILYYSLILMCFPCLVDYNPT